MSEISENLVTEFGDMSQACGNPDWSDKQDEKDKRKARKELEDYIENLESKVATQDAIIERLVEAGRLLSDYANWFSLDHPSIGDGQMAINDKATWDALVAEVQTLTKR